MRLGGLTLVLRLALDAQAGGAAAVVLPAGNAALAPLLADERLRVPVVAEPPERARRVHVPASFLVHRALFRHIAEHDLGDAAAPRLRDLGRDSFPHNVPWGFSPIDVRDAATRHRAERALFRSLRKAEDGWTSRYLNRYLSLALSRWLVKTSLHPNQISVGILCVGLLGAVLATRGTYATLLAGAALFQAQSVLDGCDGEVSRISYRGSVAGEWWDTVGDDLTNYAFFAGAALGLYRASGSLQYPLAGLVGVVAGLVASGLEYRYLLRIGSGDLLKYPLSRPGGAGRLSVLQPLLKRDTFVFLTLLATLFGVLGVMLYAFAAGALGVLGAVVGTELRLARERRAQSGSPV